MSIVKYGNVGQVWYDCGIIRSPDIVFEFVFISRLLIKLSGWRFAKGIWLGD